MKTKPSSVDRATHHQKTRLARSSEIAQDYVEAIADLIDTCGEARVIDIARQLGVSHVTVNRTITRLQRDKLVSSEKYRSVFLTEKGRSLAEEVRRRHKIVLEFLQHLGVSLRTALNDAEGIEHYVSDETLRAFEKVLKSKRR